MYMPEAGRRVQRHRYGITVKLHTYTGITLNNALEYRADGLMNYILTLT